MPGKKRKAAAAASSSEAGSVAEGGTTTKIMWGSSSSSPTTSSSSNNNSSRRTKASSVRRTGSGKNLALERSSSLSGNDSKAEKMFEEICDEDNPDAAGMEGICKLCEQLNLDPLEDVRVLVLLWKLGANKKPAEIQKDEWISGCRQLQLDSIDKFKKILPSLDTGFMEREEFADFYKFCFQFNRAGTHKTLDKDMVIALLNMCLTGGRISPHRLETFCNFLQATKDENYSKITLDQWRSFLDFSYEYPDADALKSYDESESAWPVLIDEYCEYMAKLEEKKK